MLDDPNGMAALKRALRDAQHGVGQPVVVESSDRGTAELNRLISMIDRLATKSFIVGTVLIAVSALAGVILFANKIRASIDGY